MPAPKAAPPPPAARFAANGRAQRVILVSFDGLSADAVTRFGVPALENMTARVSRVVPVTPTATSSAHAAILTGLTPQKTGIVSNQFHKPGTPREETAKGLETEIDGDTIVDTARRAGKRTGCIEFPLLDSRSPRRTCDFGTNWTGAISRSAILHFSHSDFHKPWLPPTWGAPAAARHESFSPVLRVRFEWSVPKRVREDVDIAAYDTTDDHVANYDTFYVETPDGETPIGRDGWFSISTHTETGLLGVWAKILRHDATLDSMTLYVGPAAQVSAYPAEFHDLIDTEAGFMPGPADEVRAREWIAGGDGIDPQTFAEQQSRFSDFQTRVTLLAMQREQFDLLLSYQPIADETEHQFAIERPLQIFATPEHIAAAGQVLRSVYGAINRAVDAMAKQIDPAREALIVTGDHGYFAYDMEVRLNTILPPNWRAYSNGDVAHLYRFGEPANDDAVVKQLTDLHAPDGAPVFEHVERRSASSHPNSGDVVAFTWPRFALSNGGGETFARVPSYGQHGGLNSHPEFHTTLGATGAGIPAMRLEMMQQTEIAPVVRELLGLGK